MQKSKLWSSKEHENTFCSIRMHHNLPSLMEKNGQKWPFFGQKMIFLASDKRLKTAPLF